MLVGVKLVVEIVFRKVKQVNLVTILKRAEIVLILLLVVMDENGINQDMIDTKMIPCPWTNTTIQEDVDQEKV